VCQHKYYKNYNEDIKYGINHLLLSSVCFKLYICNTLVSQLASFRELYPVKMGSTALYINTRVIDIKQRTTCDF